MQISPYILEGVKNLVDAANPFLSNKNPYAVISNLQMSCTDDAAASHQEPNDNKEKDPHTPVEECKSGVSTPPPVLDVCSSSTQI